MSQSFSSLGTSYRTIYPIKGSIYKLCECLFSVYRHQGLQGRMGGVPRGRHSNLLFCHSTSIEKRVDFSE
jgi:hypothetical protein